MIVLHKNKKCVGIRVGKTLVTHNMVLIGEHLGRNFEPCAEADVPEKLKNFLATARRRAEDLYLTDAKEG